MSYPLSNILIDSLDEAARGKLMGRLRPVPAPSRMSLYEPDQRPRYVHFLTSGIASILTVMSDGSSTEVGTVGREGLPQGFHLLGPAPVPSHCSMQIAGTALRMEFDAFEELFRENEAVRTICLAYVQYQTLLLGQIAGCNRLHDVQARLARWLLMIGDRTGDSTLQLTHEFLGQMIGSQRTTVSAVAGALQARGAIEYVRGTVRILDRKRLQDATCECYPITRSLLGGLYAHSSEALLSAEEGSAG